MAVACLNNRAACYLQLQSYQDVVQDTSEVQGPSCFKAFAAAVAPLRGSTSLRSCRGTQLQVTTEPPVWPHVGR